MEKKMHREVPPLYVRDRLFSMTYVCARSIDRSALGDTISEHRFVGGKHRAGEAARAVRRCGAPVYGGVPFGLPQDERTPPLHRSKFRVARWPGEDVPAAGRSLFRDAFVVGAHEHRSTIRDCSAGFYWSEVQGTRTVLRRSVLRAWRLACQRHNSADRSERSGNHSAHSEEQVERRRDNDHRAPGTLLLRF